MSEKKAKPKAEKKVESKAEKTEQFKYYVSREAHLLVHVIRSPKHTWRARRMLNDGRYVWKIPADETEAFEAHGTFRMGSVLPFDEGKD